MIVRCVPLCHSVRIVQIIRPKPSKIPIPLKTRLFGLQSCVHESRFASEDCFLWLKFERTALLLASQIKGWTESTDVLWYFQIFVFYIGGLKSLMFSIVLCDFVMYSWDVRVPGIPKKSSVQLILWRSQQRRRPRQSRTPLQRRCITLQHRRRRKWPTCLGFSAICVVHLVLFPQLLIYLNTFSSRVYT